MKLGSVGTIFKIMVGRLVFQSFWCKSMIPFSDFVNFCVLQMLTRKLSWLSVSFFSHVKIKRVRETYFLPFCDFFHGQKIAFTHTFLQLFTGATSFSRALLWIFSRTAFCFHGEDIAIFSKLSRMDFFFSQVKN